MKLSNIPFAKISATGNDFILFDNRTQIFSGRESEYFRTICQRRTGVGADGVILLENSKRADFRMRYFNADGNEAEMCGNGARSVAFWAHYLGIVDEKMCFESQSALHRAEIKENGVRVQMPTPEAWNLNIRIGEEYGWEIGGFVRVGVPHYVLFVDDLEQVDVPTIGHSIRHDSAFVHGTNVDFVQLLSPQKLRLRTYERGVETETLSCGTGAIASAVIAYRKKNIRPPVEVQAPGGILWVDFDRDFKEVFLEGSVTLVFEGKLFIVPERD